MAARPKAVVAWSSGKDSAWALHNARSSGEVEVVGVLTTLTEAYDRVSMHGVRQELLDRQLSALGLPCTKVWIPTRCTDEIYGQRMGEALAGLRAQGVTHLVFGDLFLADLRAYREEQLAAVGMKAVFPLWGRDTRELVQEMLAGGLRAVLTTVDPKVLDPGFAGRVLNEGLLQALPSAVDPCGENGEFHTVVVEGPMFREAIAVEVGEVVRREGFVFADVVPRPPGVASWVSALEGRLGRAGLDLVQAFDAAAYNESVAGVEGLAPVGLWGRQGALALLIGNTGALWPRFLQALREDPALRAASDPLDQYVEGVLTEAVAASPVPLALHLGHEGGDRLVSLVRAAAVSGLAHVGPAHLAVHPVVGPWFGLRALLVLDAAAPPEAPPAPDPCAACEAPCRVALDRALVEDRWRAWVAVREVCPEGRGARYGEGQLHYHYTKDRARLLAEAGLEEARP